MKVWKSTEGDQFTHLLGRRTGARHVVPLGRRLLRHHRHLRLRLAKRAAPQRRHGLLPTVSAGRARRYASGDAIFALSEHAGDFAGLLVSNLALLAGALLLFDLARAMRGPRWPGAPSGCSCSRRAASICPASTPRRFSFSLCIWAFWWLETRPLRAGRAGRGAGLPDALGRRRARAGAAVGRLAEQRRAPLRSGCFPRWCRRC